MWHGLETSWVGSLIIVGLLIWFTIVTWSAAPQAERKDVKAAWSGVFVWVIPSLLLLQIALYDPTMNDSLCYRLPRIFLWLQEGQISRVQTADFRINSMPWGWEALAIPFASLNAMTWSGLINLGAWAVIFQISFQWARDGGVGDSRARWIALALSTAPGFLIQAASTANDFYTFALLLIATHFVLQYSRKPTQADVYLSLLALVLATSVKPQFLVFGACWGLWWLFGPQRPYKKVNWVMLCLVAPLLIFLSPVPQLWENRVVNGSIMGVAPNEMDGSKTSAPMMMIAGSLQFAASQLQLPLAPHAELLNKTLTEFPGSRLLQLYVPKFTPGITPVAMIDSASFGLIHALVVALGIGLAWKPYPTARWLLLASVTGFAIAASQVVLFTIGRSFMGFFALLLPVAALGLARLSRKRCILLVCIATATGLAATILNPSSPLWPSKTLEPQAAKYGGNGVAAKFKAYNDYQARADTGLDILDSVPAGESVNAIFRSFTPLYGLWVPNWKKHRIKFIHHEDPDKFTQSDARWLLIGEKAVEEFPNANLFGNPASWQVVAQKDYLPNIKQGIETWTLYRRISN